MLQVAGQIEQAGDPTELNSLLLAGLVERLAAGPRFELVDIGPAREATIAFFSQFHCRLHIEDAIAALARPAPSTDEEGAWFEGRLKALLTPPASIGEVDAVLCWDLLDHLSRPRLAAFAAHLAPWLRRGAHLHAFISTRPDIPGQPAGFEVLEASTVRVQPRPGPLQPAPRYHQLDLGRLMPQFAVERSVLLRNGLQEYLLRRH
ncbi:MAG TPA: hypothetical protein VKA50_13200 [Gammaproteobacteria bacterium]|nr:hypothetical protein [Gammaproteobacteria bacterium]